jgi:hypothetical protein
MKLRIHNITLSFFILICVGILTSYAQSRPSIDVTDEKTRLTVFISDLHLGPGKEDTGEEWLRIEDFRWEKEFDEFATFIAKESDNNTDLIIIGDMFELWQSSNMVCDGKGNRSGGGEDLPKST